MTSIAPSGTVRISDMALADDIEQLILRRPGLTELALAKSPFGRMGYQQRVNSICQRLFSAGNVERRGIGSPGHPFTYHPGKVERRFK